MLDVRNYTWVDIFEPESISAPSNITPSQNPTLTNTTKIAICTISGIIGMIGIAIFMAIFYRWHQRRKGQPPTQHILGIPGNVRYNHGEHNLPGTAVEYNRSNYIPA